MSEIIKHPKGQFCYCPCGFHNAENGAEEWWQLWYDGKMVAMTAKIQALRCLHRYLAGELTRGCASLPPMPDGFTEPELVEAESCKQ